MRRLISLLAFAGALGCASPALAQLAPPPKLIVTKLDHVPMVELYDGGGGLPYLGSSTAYNAGDWENALRAYANTNGTDSSIYLNQIAQVDAVAQKTIDRTVKAAKQARHRHRHGHV